MTKAEQRVRVAIDAMGGDYAPDEIVKGAVAAAEKGDVEVILVGPIDTVEAELAKYNISGLPIHCVKADDFIKEEEHPALAVRRKPNSSIAVATKMVKTGEADGLLGATATGALVTSAIQFLGMVEGIDRPVLGGVLSGTAPNTVIFDLGVNMDCKPQHLLTFAIIGTVYARIFLNIANPTVALLSIGKEEGKGNQLARETYPLLQKSGLNFIGNVEGNGILTGQANVIVCDAFVGNVIFKFSESGAEIIGNYFKSKMKSYPMISHLLKDKVKDLVASLSLPDSVGGGLIWGVDGIVLKMHGHSRAPDVTKKIAQVKMAVESDIVGCLKSELATIRKKLNL
ncbi:MAG: phosphate acyltransferase PlsX [Dehalococcoidia bacterium]|nr:MAG: phosphate acyltransferase PlsX [Dehalococcoidia bacterium]